MSNDNDALRKHKAEEAVCNGGHSFVFHTGRPVEECPMFADHQRLAGLVRNAVLDEIRPIIEKVIADEAQDALDTGIRPINKPELGAWNYVAKHFKQWAPLAAERIIERMRRE